MSAVKYDLMEGDTLSTIKVIITNSVTKARIPLATLFTAQIVFQITDGDTAGPVNSQAMTVLSGADDGIVEYQFQAGELIPGIMQAQVKITEISSSKVATTINGIRKVVGASL
jgi:hypothetical protein